MADYDGQTFAAGQLDGGNYAGKSFNNCSFPEVIGANFSRAVFTGCTFTKFTNCNLAGATNGKNPMDWSGVPTPRCNTQAVLQLNFLDIRGG